MGILDDRTLRILRDGKILDTMHRISDRRVTDRGVKVDVTVRNEHGQSVVKRVIIRKVAH